MAGNLITHDQRAQMLANGQRSAEDEAHDPFPVVKLFVNGRATWLLCDLDPDDDDIAFGLCDLGQGFPELGSVRLSEIASLSRHGFAVRRDDRFVATMPISGYARLAYSLGWIDA